MPIVPIEPTPATRAPLNESAFLQTLRRTSLGLIFALAIPVVALLGLVTYLLHTAQCVDHSDRVVAEIATVETLALEAQSGFRGWQLTSEPSALAPYEGAVPQMEKLFGGLATLVSDDPRQSAAVRKLRVASAAWHDFAERSMAQPRAGSAEVSSAKNLLPDAQLMDAFREQVAAMRAEELRLRAERNHHLGQIAFALFALLGVAALAGIPTLTVWLARRTRSLANSYQASLAESQEVSTELTVTLRAIGDAVLATDAAGAVSFLNPVAEQLTGWTDAEARGRLFTEVLPIFNEETGQPAENPVERVLREGVIVGLANHTVLRPRRGGEIPIADSAAPIFRADGSLRGVILVFRDVTEKHAHDLALREAEWRSRMSLDAGGGAAWVVEISRGVVAGDPLLARWFNVPVEECRTGAPIPAFFAAVHEADRATVTDAVGRSMETGADYHVTFRATGADGVQRWFDSRGRVQRDAAGKAARIPGMILDITALKAADAVLAERTRLSALRSDLSYRLASAAALDGTLQKCCEDIVRHLDASFARIWTLAENESVLILRASAGLYTHLDGPHARVSVGSFKIGRIAQSRQPHLTNDVANDPNVSDPAWAAREGMVAFAGYPLLAEGRVVGVLALFAQHTLTDAVLADLAPLAEVIAHSIERKDAEAALREAKEKAESASRAKDNFLAALSHELRTPLMPVLMTAAALREDERLPAEVRDQLGMMERNIALEGRLIDDLLDVTRITQGKLSLRPQPCDAHSLIGLAVEIVRDDAQAKGIVIDRDFEAAQSGLSADPARFQQVIWNLLRNSVKFTPQDGHITIRTSNVTEPGDQPSLRIEVIDSGVGIEAASIDLIFQPFEQAGQAGEHRFGGLGLGLAIARAIVDLHGGTIHAESAGLGRGATFIVDLPGATEPPHGVAVDGTHPRQKSTGQRGRPLRILLVEDHGATLAVLTRLLTRAGHEVVAVANVANALAAARSQLFDLVISDLGLPDGTGTELMAELRVNYGLRGIALSGYGMEQDMQRTREAGFITHLVKPVDFNELRRTLENLS